MSSYGNFAARNAGRVLGIAITLSTAAVGLGQRYVLTELRPPSGHTHSYALGVNDNGVAVGYVYSTSVWDVRAWIYRGDGVELFMNDVVTFSQANAINNAGLITGTMDYEAFRWDDGVVEPLGSMAGAPGESSYGMAINESGSVAGFGHVASPYSKHAFRCEPNSPLEDIGPFDAHYSEGLGMNDGDLIVGWARDPNGFDVAAVWDPNGITWLPVLPTAQLPFSEARDVNNLNQIVGVSLFDPNACYSCNTAALWENGQITDLGRFLGQAASEANAINDAGQVVGEAEVNGATPHAALWQNGELIDLNKRIPPGSDWELATATDISENGYIVGYAFVEGEYGARGFLLTPVAPLPGDMNCDGVVDFGDINPFVMALTAPATYADIYEACDNGDLDNSGDTGFSDINPFVAMLVGA